jgi:hypothetical protein
MVDERSVNARVPPSAAWLGALGFIPFAALAATLPFAAGDLKSDLTYALLAYGAIILSFLGGVHWGLAIGSTAPAAAAALKGRLLLSVIPSLVAWAALVVPARSGLFTLAAAIALMLVVDIRATRAGAAPAWYPRLRIPLSCAVAASLLVGAWSVVGAGV